MNPRDLLDMAGDPRFIPGIYNYCDRWCERCAYTGRCLNFVHGEIMAAELEEDDESEALAEQLSESLQDAVDLIEIIAEEEGIELDLDSPEVEEMMAQEERARERAASHPLAGAADPYIGMVNDWFGVGNGWTAYAAVLAQCLPVDGWQGERYPRAGNVARLAAAPPQRNAWVSADQALPVYLRNKIASKSV